jgi:hypothetical protein
MDSIDCEWSAHDDGSGNVYYMNTAGESSWEMPEAYRIIKNQGPYSSLPSSQMSRALKEALDSGFQEIHGESTWIEERDEASGIIFYFNTRTGESTWVKPPDFDGDSSELYDSEKIKVFSRSTRQFLLRYALYVILFVKMFLFLDCKEGHGRETQDCSQGATRENEQSKKGI